MRCIVKLYRPYDRRPGDHKYGQPFDEQLDAFVGGASNWEKQANVAVAWVAEASDPGIRVELHESGPEFSFFVEHASDLATYVGTLATLISTWVSVRRAFAEPRDSVSQPDGTIIQLGDLKIMAGRDLTPEEIQSIATVLLNHARERTGSGKEQSVDA